jgi:hypothetical protein
MNKSNRDLLVLLKQELMTPLAIEKQIDSIHQLLFNVERLDSFVSAHELIDLNRYKVYKSEFEIKKLIRSRKDKPFVFLNNVN